MMITPYNSLKAHVRVEHDDYYVVLETRYHANISDERGILVSSHSFIADDRQHAFAIVNAINKVQ